MQQIMPKESVGTRNGAGWDGTMVPPSRGGAGAVPPSRGGAAIVPPRGGAGIAPPGATVPPRGGAGATPVVVAALTTDPIMDAMFVKIPAIYSATVYWTFGEDLFQLDFEYSGCRLNVFFPMGFLQLMKSNGW
jgi:hypothetical protein